ncbi:Hypothetical predicted protein [Podarcis lilfordi]|uniref:Uncharacterized protein n=1 Tax=Podarcis lilfordi TaxID=74358 RepID=A0AA35K6J4_9SAUR|nr:Hypothetical predicted protein [Podarcis lilfordi]
MKIYYCIAVLSEMFFVSQGQTGFIETREACEAAEGWCQEGPCSIGPMEIGKCDTWIFCCSGNYGN